jgi:hypothetical protein
MALTFFVRRDETDKHNCCDGKGLGLRLISAKLFSINKIGIVEFVGQLHGNFWQLFCTNPGVLWH